jgi:L-ribulose-5-phosphate 3-epimerase
MGPSELPSDVPGPLSRRELLAYSAAFGPAFLAAQGLLGTSQRQALEPQGQALGPQGRAKRYPMQKSINMWAFPYPAKMDLRQCFELAARAGFEGIEVNYALEGDISPQTKEQDLKRIARMADDLGLRISGVCSFLYWPFSLTSNDPKRRQRGLELTRQMIRAAHALGTENLLVIAGSVYIPWVPDQEPVPYDVCDQRAQEAIRALLPEAEAAGVFLNIENIFANGFLLSPDDMVRFVDSFHHPRVRVHFDTGNIMQFQFPEDWIRRLGSRIQNVHFKEYNKRVQEFNLDAFRLLLDGTTNWPAVLEALDSVGYRGFVTFEYFHPFEYWPEALIYQTSDALDRMLGRG